MDTKQLTVARRRQLDGSSQRLLLFGDLAVLLLAQLVRGLSGLSFWPGLALGLAVALAGRARRSPGGAAPHRSRSRPTLRR